MSPLKLSAFITEWFERTFQNVTAVKNSKIAKSERRASDRLYSIIVTLEFTKRSLMIQEQVLILIFL